MRIYHIMTKKGYLGKRMERKRKNGRKLICVNINRHVKWMKGYWMKRCDLWKAKSIEKDDRNNWEGMENYPGRKQCDLNKGISRNGNRISQKTMPPLLPTSSIQRWLNQTKR